VQNPRGLGRNRQGDPVAFGYTAAGLYLAVPYVFLDEHQTTVYVVTAYEVPPRRG
jgi:hypothetical protein